VTAENSEGLVCFPGELAPATGVYEVSHLAHHRASHQVVVIRGEEFPICRACKAAVRYRLVRAMDHLHHDWDLAGPESWTTPKKSIEFSGLRAHPRFEIDLPIVLVEMPHTKSPTLLHGHATTLSEGGVSAVIEPRLAHPKKRLSIRLPGSGAHHDITVSARLRYQNGMRHGFQFVHVSREARLALRELCTSAGA